MYIDLFKNPVAEFIQFFLIIIPYKRKIYFESFTSSITFLYFLFIVKLSFNTYSCILFIDSIIHCCGFISRHRNPTNNIRISISSRHTYIFLKCKLLVIHYFNDGFTTAIILEVKLFSIGKFKIPYSLKQFINLHIYFLMLNFSFFFNIYQLQRICSQCKKKNNELFRLDNIYLLKICLTFY